MKKIHKKILLFFGSFILGLSAIASVVSSNNQKNIGQKEQTSIENGSMSLVSQKLTNIFNNSQKVDNFIENDTKDTKIFTRNLSVSTNGGNVLSQFVFENIRLNSSTNQLEIDIQNVKETTNDQDLIEVLTSEDFKHELNEAYKNKNFVIDSETSEVVYNDQVSEDAEKLDIDTLLFDDESTNDASVQTRSSLISDNGSISKKDFWTESHWYWFSFKIYQMTNKGREWLVKNSAILMIKKQFETLYRMGLAVAKQILKASIRSGGNIYLFVAEVLILIANVVLLASCLITLANWSNTGASIKYFSFSGTIICWNKR